MEVSFSKKAIYKKDTQNSTDLRFFLQIDIHFKF